MEETKTDKEAMMKILVENNFSIENEWQADHSNMNLRATLCEYDGGFLGFYIGGRSGHLMSQNFRRRGFNSPQKLAKIIKRVIRESEAK